MEEATIIIEKHVYTRKEVADMFGISISTLYREMKKAGIDRKGLLRKSDIRKFKAHYE